MLAGPQQIDFDEMNLAAKNLPLLLTIDLLPFFARRLVGGAQDLDAAHEPFLVSLLLVNFEKVFGVLVLQNL